MFRAEWHGVKVGPGPRDQGPQSFKVGPMTPPKAIF